MDKIHLLDKLYRKTALGTAFFAVLCVVLFVIYGKNETFFETHGKLGNLAEQEQQQFEMENSKKQYSKKHISVEIADKPEGKLKIPLEKSINASQIAVREEFLQNKLLITIKDTNQLIANNVTVQSDSDYMNAISLYKQKDDTVLELFCKDIYSYTYEITDDSFVVQFGDLNDTYKTKAVIYVPYEQRDKFASEEWSDAVMALAEKNGCKIFLCPQMQEKYTPEQVVEFANRKRADYLLAVDVDTCAEQGGMEIICNPEYFIPEFHSVDLGILMGESIKSKTNLPILAMTPCMETDKLILDARMPAALVKISMQKEAVKAIEEEYSFFHNTMEGITLSLSELITIQN